jgi:hypothetical protein
VHANFLPALLPLFLDFFPSFPLSPEFSKKDVHLMFSALFVGDVRYFAYIGSFQRAMLFS